MNFRFISHAAVRLAVMALPLWTYSANAQGRAPSTSPSPQTMTETAPAAFRSALEGYKPYTDEKTVNWKEVNDNAGRIGGWREYAKEASQPESGARQPAPDAATRPGPGAVPAKP